MESPEADSDTHQQREESPKGQNAPSPRQVLADTDNVGPPADGFGPVSVELRYPFTKTAKDFSDKVVKYVQVLL